jgi:chromosome segregation ATPase
MSDENTTAEQPDARSFEERVFARFDAIDARLTKLEEAAERRAMETKPIWERSLSEIIETRAEMNARFDNVERKLDVLNRDILQLRADYAGQDSRITRLEESRA